MQTYEPTSITCVSPDQAAARRGNCQRPRGPKLCEKADRQLFPKRGLNATSTAILEALPILDVWWVSFSLVYTEPLLPPSRFIRRLTQGIMKFINFWKQLPFAQFAGNFDGIKAAGSESRCADQRCWEERS